MEIFSGGVLVAVLLAAFGWLWTAISEMRHDIKDLYKRDEAIREFARVDRDMTDIRTEIASGLNRIDANVAALQEGQREILIAVLDLKK